MREMVLGLPIDVVTKAESLEIVESWIERPAGKLRLLVTAYSEFYVNALRDKEFARIIKKADLVSPDGRSVLAAVAYGHAARRLQISDYRPARPAGGSQMAKVFTCIWEGMKVGGRILKNDLGETVTGVWLFEELAEMASKKGWKIFLLGGWGDVSARAARMLTERFPKIKVLSDPGEEVVGASEEDNKRIVEKINKFKPDILFVQYRPIQQEKWIEANRKDLKVKVAVGIGGTLNEFTGGLRLAPEWMQRMGLKWLWRLWLEPRRWRRMIDAVIVFPWLVFRESLKS